MSEQQFLVIGEALMDCVDREGTVIETAGGSPMNVAIGLGRLNQQVTLATRFGVDVRGRAIAEHLEQSHVSLIPKASGLPATSTASAAIAADGSATYLFDIVWDLEAGMVPSGTWGHVHAGSIGATLDPGSRGVLDIIKRERDSGATISYDPNARPDIMGDPDDVRHKVEAVIGLSDLVKASDEDLAWLYPGWKMADVLSRWRDLGAIVIMITRGADGVEAHTVTDSLSLPIKATTVADTIGAGDSFMAGLLSALSKRGLVGHQARESLASLSKKDLEEVISFALECAAITVSRSGANPPTLDDLTPASSP